MLPVCQRVGHLVGKLQHRFSVGCNSLTMKPWLDQSSLAHMERFFAGQQSLAQHKFRALHHNAAVLHGRVAHQHFLHHVGMIELKNMPSEGLVVNQVAKRLRIPLEKLVGAESAEVPDCACGRDSWGPADNGCLQSGSQGSWVSFRASAVCASSLHHWPASD